MTTKGLGAALLIQPSRLTSLTLPHCNCTPTPPQVRDTILVTCVEVLYAYRRFCASGNAPGQLILPEALKLLPLFSMAITKSELLRLNSKPLRGRLGEVAVRCDRRVAAAARVMSGSVGSWGRSIYPRFIALHTLPDDCGVVPGDGALAKIPPNIAPSAERVLALLSLSSIPLSLTSTPPPPLLSHYLTG